MTRLRATIILMLLFCCTTPLFSQGPTATDNRHSYPPVSLIRVIANPNDFNGQPVRVIGFLAPGGGLDMSVGLFVSEADGRNYVVPNSIDLHLDRSSVGDLMGSYVTLSGTYHAPDPRAAGYNGYIDHVVEIKRWGLGNSSK
jgi:hypothetical protein